MGILSLSLGESKGAGERGKDREGKKRGKKGKERERVEGEPRRIEKRSHRRRYVCERGRDTERETEREATEIYRIQSTDVPESERARKSEKIGL